MIEEELIFDDIKNNSLDYLPSQGHWNIWHFCDDKNNQPYLFESIEIKKENSKLILTFFGDIDSERYNYKFFYPIFERSLKTIINDQALCDLDSEVCQFYFEVSVNKILESKTIEKILEIYNEKIKLVYSLAFQEADKDNLLSGTINLKFNFPKHLKDICKQYLSYFGKFLSDYNVKNKLSLIDKNDITHLVIDIDESKVDFEELQKALTGYFYLPAISQENIIFNNQDIAIQQLIANIEHLKSQLRLANITITQYENNDTINSQRPIEYVLLNSLDEDSKLKLFDGFIKVGKVIKLKFFGVDIEFDMPLLPSLIDKVKSKRKDND